MPKSHSRQLALPIIMLVFLFTIITIGWLNGNVGLVSRPFVAEKTNASGLTETTNDSVTARFTSDDIIIGFTDTSRPRLTIPLSGGDTSQRRLQQASLMIDETTSPISFKEEKDSLHFDGFMYDALEEGMHTLTLNGTTTNGQTIRAQQRVLVDHTPPEVNNPQTNGNTLTLTITDSLTGPNPETVEAIYVNKSTHEFTLGNKPACTNQSNLQITCQFNDMSEEKEIIVSYFDFAENAGKFILNPDKAAVLALEKIGAEKIIQQMESDLTTGKLDDVEGKTIQFQGVGQKTIVINMEIFHISDHVYFPTPNTPQVDVTLDYKVQRAQNVFSILKLLWNHAMWEYDYSSITFQFVITAHYPSDYSGTIPSGIVSDAFDPALLADPVQFKQRYGVDLVTNVNGIKVTQKDVTEALYPNQYTIGSNYPSIKTPNNLILVIADKLFGASSGDQFGGIADIEDGVAYLDMRGTASPITVPLFFELAATHETGHLLGLGHTSKWNSFMNSDPFLLSLEFEHAARAAANFSNGFTPISLGIIAPRAHKSQHAASSFCGDYLLELEWHGSTREGCERNYNSYSTQDPKLRNFSQLCPLKWDIRSNPIDPPFAETLVAGNHDPAHAMQLYGWDGLFCLPPESPEPCTCQWGGSGTVTPPIPHTPDTEPVTDRAPLTGCDAWSGAQCNSTSKASFCQTANLGDCDLSTCACDGAPHTCGSDSKDECSPAKACPNGKYCTSSCKCKSICGWVPHQNPETFLVQYTCQAKTGQTCQTGTCAATSGVCACT